MSSISIYTKFFLLPLLLTIYYKASANQNTVQIISNQIPSLCKNATVCYTFLDCLLNTSSCFTSNTTVLLPPGEITTGQVQQLVLIRDVENLRLEGCSDKQYTTIKCLKNVGFGIVNAVNISIKNIKFQSCGGVVPNQTLQEAFGNFIYEENEGSIKKATITAAVYLMSVFNLRMSHVHISSSQSFGLFAVNILGLSFISKSSFTQSNRQTHRMDCTANQATASGCLGGNVFIVFNDTTDCYSKYFKLFFEHSLISNGINSGSIQFDAYDHEPVKPAGGISIVLRHATYSSVVYIRNTTIHSNVATAGGNCAIYVLNPIKRLSQIFLIGVKISKGNKGSDKYLKTQPDSGGLYFHYRSDKTRINLNRLCFDQQESEPALTTKLKILNTTFTENKGLLGGAMLFNNDETLYRYIFSVAIFKCYLVNNYGHKSILLFHHTSGLKESSFEMTKTTISNNTSVHTLQHSFSDIAEQSTVLFDNAPTNCYITNCTIQNNTFQGIKFVKIASVFFLGYNYIANNSGKDGGGIHLAQSVLKSTKKTRLIIENNRARYGGGVFVDRGLKCFLDTPSSNYTRLYLKNNNFAVLSGNSLFGDLTNCLNRMIPIWDIVSVPWNNSLTEVASTLRQICVCVKEMPQCQVRKWEHEIFPGQLLLVPAVAVSQMNGTTPSTGITTVTGGKSVHIAATQTRQLLGKVCENLTYRLLGEEGIVVELKIADIDDHHASQTLSTSNTLSVTIKKCPVGFALNNTCQCEEFLANRGVTCDINKQTFRNSKPSWVGFTKDDQILFHDTCPKDKCLPTRLNFIANDTDLQCGSGHTGVLCGGCAEGLSSVFGSTECMDCSNSHIAFLVVFLFAGMALVFVMILCNLTLSKGTLNALIFYANIVQVNHTIIFPQDQYNILPVFIAWFNLDLGIKTCFYNGMTVYQRTWLQYLFPIYIWVIILFVISASWYSKTVAKICGKNAVAVLATLLLLSYTKIQRIVLESCSFTSIATNNGTRLQVWLSDGNVVFFEPKHAVLFLTALMAAVVFIIPFTLVLLCEQLLLAKCGRIVVKYKMKPFFDVYHSPNENKYIWWTGFMLLVRSALLLAYTANTLGNPRINLVLVIIMCSGVMALRWNLGKVYKQWIVNTIESFYLQNLILLALFTLYISYNSDNIHRDQAIVFYTLVGSAFLVFLVIVSYHTLMQMKAFKNSSYWCLKKKPTLQEEPLEEGAPRVPTVSYIELTNTPQHEENYISRRESLLFSTATY